MNANKQRYNNGHSMWRLGTIAYCVLFAILFMKYDSRHIALSIACIVLAFVGLVIAMHGDEEMAAAVWLENNEAEDKDYLQAQVNKINKYHGDKEGRVTTIIAKREEGSVDRAFETGLIGDQCITSIIVLEGMSISITSKEGQI